MGQYTGKEELLNMVLCSNYNHHILEIITKNIAPLQKDSKIMDFGAGIGTLAKILEVKTNIKPLCFEIDPEQITLLKQHNFAVISDLALVENNSLNFIYTSNVLEHIEDDQEILRQLHAKLQIGGRLVIYVPAFMHLYTAM